LRGQDTVTDLEDEEVIESSMLYIKELLISVPRSTDAETPAKSKPALADAETVVVNVDASTFDLLYSKPTLTV
jgi:hypothetical protein